MDASRISAGTIALSLKGVGDLEGRSVPLELEPIEVIGFVTALPLATPAARCTEDARRCC